VSLLEANDLAVERDGRVVVSVERLTLEAGETLALLGPNGAGKTSLLLALASLLPARGTVRWHGDPIRDRLAYRRRIAVVFQRPLLLDRSVTENAGLGLELRGVASAERKRRVDELLGRLGIAHLASRPARRLSGGEAQRVSIARALAVDPEILFLDEPFGALDAPARESLTADLAQLLRERRIGTILVTHDRDEALSLGDRIAVIMRGNIRQTDRADTVFSNPADPEVAAFVGVENVLPAHVASVTAELTTLAVGDHLIEVTAVPPPGDDFPLLCVRPDDIVIARGEGTSSARNVLASRVVRLEPIGRRVRVILDCGFPLVAHVTVRSARELELAPGQEVTASFKATVPHLLPRHRPARSRSDPLRG
jgi:tungstate transport system ATP-binding protein